MRRRNVDKRLKLSPTNTILRDDVVAKRRRGQETDHIRPLFGKYVWSFDAHYNLENIDAAINNAKSNYDPTDAQLLKVSRIKTKDLPTLHDWLQGVAGALDETKRTEARDKRNARRRASAAELKVITASSSSPSPIQQVPVSPMATERVIPLVSALSIGAS